MKDTIEKLIDGTTDLVSRVEKNVSFLIGLLQGLELEPKVVEKMTYEEAIGFFIDQRPGNEDAKRGVILRETNPQGCLFIQAFLDGENNVLKKRNGVPYGRKLVVKEFDAELAERFSDKDMILVE